MKQNLLKRLIETNLRLKGQLEFFVFFMKRKTSVTQSVIKTFNVSLVKLQADI